MIWSCCHYWVTLQLPDLLRVLAVVPPLRVQGALKKQELLLQLGLLPVCSTAPLLQLTVQTLQLTHWLGHLCVVLPQSRRRVRLGAQEVVGFFQLSIETETTRGGKIKFNALSSTRPDSVCVCVCVCVYCIPDSAAGQFCHWRPESSGWSSSYLQAAPLKLKLEKKNRWEMN